MRQTELPAWSLRRFVAGRPQPHSFGVIARAQADLAARLDMLDIITSVASEQAIELFHAVS